MKTDIKTNDVYPSVLQRLLPWFRRKGRDLPWRKRRTPYRVLVSELMLQQTRVSQAQAYYIRFLRHFPSLRSLARANLDDVLKAWEGLGYYARARNLHRLAREITERSNGHFPRTIEGLQTLPGVGPYTAAAVGSLALGLQAAVVDGNVRRVLCRVFGDSGSGSATSSARRLRKRAQALLVPGKAGLCNEAWMELGALICTPRQPVCSACPLRRICTAFAQGCPEGYPARRARGALPHKHVGAAVIRDRSGRYLIAKRRESDMLGGLWEFPGGKQKNGEAIPSCIARELKEEMGLNIKVGKQIAVIRHTYSHFSMDLFAHEATVIEGVPHCLQCADFAWIQTKDFVRYAFSRADQKIIDVLKKS